MSDHRHIYLYGPPGSGKSYLGSKLAQSLELGFVDLDQAIEHQSGKTIRSIFAEEGEIFFRQLESEVLRQVGHSEKSSVVALGGGALLDPRNAEYATRTGQVIALAASEETLLKRMGNQENQRPLLAEALPDRLHQLLEDRHEHYANFATVHVDHLACDQILDLLQVKTGRFRVRGMGAAYPVEVRKGILTQIAEVFKREGLQGPVLLISDENVAPLYAMPLKENLKSHGYETDILILPPGEAHKNLAAIEKIWQAALIAGLERGSTIVALGGGVVSDLAGFAAATYMRGIRWVTCPTSLLAMVDASLGGKTGFDLPQGKNLVGAFHAPAAVLVDPECLNTLPEIELRNGMAEVLKHGIISSEYLLKLSCQPQWSTKLDEIVPLAMQTKIHVLSHDPFEKGIRAILNFGHTIGHALELVSGFSLRHGEAVAIGMLAESKLAVEMGLAERLLPEQIAECLQFHSLPVKIPPQLETDDILAAMTRDKKKKAGEVRFVLPRRIGDASYGNVVEVDLIKQMIESLKV